MNSPGSGKCEFPETEPLDHFSVVSPVVFYRAEAFGDYRCTFVSGNASQIIGYGPHDLLSSANLRMSRIHPGDATRVRDELNRVLAEGRCVCEYRFRRKDGTYVWLRDDAKLIRDEEGKSVEIVGCWTDVTAHKLLEEHLCQAQKMEAVGRLAGGVAHDFRNQLTVIKGYADLLLRECLIREGGADMMLEILKAAEQSSRLTGQLLAFSRKEMLRPQVVDVAGLVAETCKPLQRIIGEDVRLVIASGEQRCFANVDPGQFQQAIMNLASNARDAMPKGGEFTIETRSAALDERYVQVHPEARPGRYTLVKVSDTGCGMDQETMGRIFEPFFTTKPQGEGTGLGLAMVYGFVTQSGGVIDVESAPGKGTGFSLYFPQVSEAQVLATDLQSTEELPGGTETILVVEDEDAVRRILGEFLRGAGYRVPGVIEHGRGVDRHRSESRQY